MDGSDWAWVRMVEARSGTRPFGRFGNGQPEQFGRFDAKGGGEDWKLVVGDAPDLSFNLGERSTADIPAEKVELGGKLGLGKALFPAQFADDGADNVLMLAHCSENRA